MKNKIVYLLGGVMRSEVKDQNFVISNLDTALRASVARECLLAEALREIADCATPNSNGTCRKMARIARKALDQ